MMTLILLMLFPSRRSRFDRCRDPLSHPDIARMSERELADLPFDPRSFCRE